MLSLRGKQSRAIVPYKKAIIIYILQQGLYIETIFGTSARGDVGASKINDKFEYAPSPQLNIPIHSRELQRREAKLVATRENVLCS